MSDKRTGILLTHLSPLHRTHITHHKATCDCQLFEPEGGGNFPISGNSLLARWTKSPGAGASLVLKNLCRQVIVRVLECNRQEECGDSTGSREERGEKEDTCAILSL